MTRLVPMNRRVPAAWLAAALLAGCGAPPNPEPEVAAARPAGEARSSGAGEMPVLGRVRGREIRADEFLARLWMRDNGAAREVLEQLVMAELAVLEAARLGLELDPGEVRSLVESSQAALASRLSRLDPPLTVDEHVRRNLGVDPRFYRRQVERDAVVQLVAERCVRAHTLTSPRVRVRILDLDDAGVAQARAALEAGESFASIAERFGGAEGLTLVRSESNDLARLAFATEPGEVGGPMVRDGHHVLLEVEAFLEPLGPAGADAEGAGSWPAIAAQVEASLARDPVGDREFVQWRHRMVERYAVDLSPLGALVGDPGP